MGVGGIQTGSSGRTYAMETNNLRPQDIHVMGASRWPAQRTAYSYNTNHAGYLAWFFRKFGPMRAAGSRLNTAFSETSNQKTKTGEESRT